MTGYLIALRRMLLVFSFLPLFPHPRPLLGSRIHRQIAHQVLQSYHSLIGPRFNAEFVRYEGINLASALVLLNPRLPCLLLIPLLNRHHLLVASVSSRINTKMPSSASFISTPFFIQIGVTIRRCLPFLPPCILSSSYMKLIMITLSTPNQMSSGHLGR